MTYTTVSQDSRRSLIVLPLVCLVLALVLALGDAPSVSASDAPGVTPDTAASPAAAPTEAQAVAGSRGEPEAPASTTVRLQIDFGDGYEVQYSGLAFTKGLSAFGVLESAAAHAHPLAFKHKGSGSTAFVSEIGGIANGRGTDGLYWQFRVNGEYGQHGAGSVPLKAGDTVRWFYGKYDPKGGQAQP